MMSIAMLKEECVVLRLLKWGMGDGVGVGGGGGGNPTCSKRDFEIGFVTIILLERISKI